MRLPKLTQKIKDVPDLSKNVFIILIIFLVGAGSFGLGRLSLLEEKSIKDIGILHNNAQEFTPQNSIASGGTRTTSASANSNKKMETVFSGENKGLYVGSRLGKVYHLPWCSGAKRIREENKIWFSSKEEAESTGYTPATNCKGI